MQIMTIFGPVEWEQTCNTCDTNFNCEGFYDESRSKRRHSEQKRRQCKECWARFKGDSTLGRLILEYERARAI